MINQFSDRDGMRDRIAEAAKKNNRSMNAEIIARLQESLAPGGTSLVALSWLDLVKALREEAKKQGAPISLTTGAGK